MLKTVTDEQTITQIGGPGGGGWTRTKEEAIELIESKKNAFYTFEGGKRAEIAVVDGPPKYLRTYADGKWTNNLLALPPCPRQR